MPLFDMFFRDTIQSSSQQLSASGTVDEFDNLSARMSAWALREHNEDGTHNLRPSGFDFVPIGSMLMWLTATPPSGWLICDGSQISRTTYVTLFTLIGTTYGAGDGSTTFNLPDLRQRFPIGKAAAGTGSVLGATGGAIDHTHSGGALSGSTGSSTVTISGSTATGSTGTGSTGTGTTSSDGGHTPHIAAGTKVGIIVNAGASTPAISVGTNNAWEVLADAGGVDLDAVPAHSHNVPSLSVPSLSVPALGVGTLAGNGHTHAVGTLTSGTTGTANPPFLVVNFIISAGV